MAKSEPKTRKTGASVDAFIASVDNDERRADAEKVLKLFRDVTGVKAEMWGDAIVGFGSMPIKNASGSELEWPILGFSPRKQNMTLYVMCSSPKQPSLFEKLGKHSTSVACLYIKRLSDVDENVLEEIVKDAWQHLTRTRREK